MPAKFKQQHQNKQQRAPVEVYSKIPRSQICQKIYADPHIKQIISKQNTMENISNLAMHSQKQQTRTLGTNYHYKICISLIIINTSVTWGETWETNIKSLETQENRRLQIITRSPQFIRHIQIKIVLKIIILREQIQFIIQIE